MIYLDLIPYRIISHLTIENKSIVWLIQLMVEKYEIVQMSISELKEGYSNGTVCMCIDEEEYPNPVLPDGEMELTKHRFACIKQYLEMIYPNFHILSQRGRKKDGLKELAASCGLNVKNLRKHILRYLQYGGSLYSVTNRRFIVKTAQDATYNGKVRGVKRNGVSNTVLNDKYLESLFEEAYDKLIEKLNKNQYDSNSKNRPTLQSAYNSMMLKYFMDSTTNTLLPDDQIPSFGRFYRWVRKYKLHDGLYRNNSISGMSKFNNARLLTGDCMYGISYPMELVEIDENETSYSLVSAINPSQSVGHAISYFAVDVLTRRIVGFSVSFANNSYAGLLNLFDSMLLPEQEYLMLLGIENETGVIPGAMFPHSIRVDHGAEYTSKALMENLTGGSTKGNLEGFPTDIHIVPVGTGSLKSIVERTFGSVHHSIQNAVQSGMGYVNDSHKSRHDKEAVMNIVDFRRVIFELVKKHNSCPIQDYPMTPELSNAVPIPTPNALWDYFKNTQISGYDVSDPDIRNAVRYGLLLKDKTFQLSRKQISYKDTLYWDIEMDTDLTYKARNLGNKKEALDVRYDPRSVNEIYRKDEKTGRIWIYKLAEKRENMKAFKPLLWPAVDKWITEQRSKRYEMIEMKKRAGIETEAKIANIADEAQSCKPKGDNITKNKKDAARIENAVVSAVDTLARNALFADETDQMTEDVIDVEETPVVSVIEAEADDIIPVIDIRDKDTLLQLYGYEEE